MLRYSQFFLVIAYAFLNNATLLIVLSVFNWKFMPTHAGAQLYCIVCWQLFCFSAIYWWPDILLAKLKARPPILEEEQLLVSCLKELQSKTGDENRYKFFILDDEGPQAFAMGQHSIVVSRGILTLLTQGELTAVLAHELGHLRSKDGVPGAAFVIALSIASLLNAVTGPGFRLLARLFRPRAYYGGYIPLSELGRSAGSILLLGLLFSLFHLWHYLLALVCLRILLSILGTVFIFLWIRSDRLVEYKQDAFAHGLGYGQDLKEALLKIAKNFPAQPAGLYPVVNYENRPLFYKRVRRLERLAGLR